jgi:hypothetical protein
MPSLSHLLLCPVGTLAQGNYRDYVLIHSQCASILGKVNGGSFEENSTCTAVVSRADRACCADTSGLLQGEGERDRHHSNDSAGATLCRLSSRAVDFGAWKSPVPPHVMEPSLPF